MHVVPICSFFLQCSAITYRTGTTSYMIRACPWHHSVLSKSVTTYTHVFTCSVSILLKLGELAAHRDEESDSPGFLILLTLFQIRFWPAQVCPLPLRSICMPMCVCARICTRLLNIRHSSGNKTFTVSEWCVVGPRRASS
jgi:hypothetical protein